MGASPRVRALKMVVFPDWGKPIIPSFILTLSEGVVILALFVGRVGNPPYAPEWRNRQTRTTQTRVPSGVWVRFPPSALYTNEDGGERLLLRIPFRCRGVAPARWAGRTAVITELDPSSKRSWQAPGRMCALERQRDRHLVVSLVFVQVEEPRDEIPFDLSPAGCWAAARLWVCSWLDPSATHLFLPSNRKPQRLMVTIQPAHFRQLKLHQQRPRSRPSSAGSPRRWTSRSGSGDFNRLAEQLRLMPNYAAEWHGSDRLIERPANEQIRFACQ